MTPGGVLVLAAWAAAGYLLGSLPFAVWITRIVAGKDIREIGSGHAGATNTIRNVSWPAGVLVFLLDVGKGFLAAWLALHYNGSLAALVAAGAGATVGHCWPWLAGFQGGMGLATSAGALLAISPLAVAVGIGIIIALLLTIRHAARAVVIAAPIIPIVYGILGWREAAWLAAPLAAIAMIRFGEDWNRLYRRLWLDR